VATSPGGGEVEARSASGQAAGDRNAIGLGAPPSARAASRSDRVEVEPNTRSLDQFVRVAIRNPEMFAQRGHAVRCCGQFDNLLGRGDPAFVQPVDQILGPAGNTGQKRFFSVAHGSLPDTWRAGRVRMDGQVSSPNRRRGMDESLVVL